MIKRKDGRWHKYITVSGRRIYFYSTEKSETKADQDISRQILLYKESQYKEKHNFKLLADAMLEEKEAAVSHSTYQSYKFALLHLAPFFDKYIEDITPLMLQNLLDSLAKQKLSYSSIHKSKITFGLVLDYGIRQGLTLSNYMRSIRLPKSLSKPHIATPADDVIKAIKDSVNTTSFGLWAFTLLCTGLRRGELAALQVKDIDFFTNTISVYRSVEYIDNKPHLKDSPKTASGIRKVPLLSMLREPLFEHCKELPQDYFVFSGETPFLASTIVNEWDKYQKEIGVKVNQHQLRHAYAKLLYRSGVDVKTAQGLLGHKNFQVTMDIYTEFDKELTTNSANKLNTFMDTIL
ncbi:MAG: tyrosine-type recombinase/integrase [Clostridia bacterium]